MQALVRFSHIAAAGAFRTQQIHAAVAQALGSSTTQYKLSSLRYDLTKLRAKGLVEKLPHSHSYRLTAEGYQICLVYLKLFEKVYAPSRKEFFNPFPRTNSFHPPASASWTVCIGQSSMLWINWYRLWD